MSLRGVWNIGKQGMRRGSWHSILRPSRRSAASSLLSQTKTDWATHIAMYAQGQRLPQWHAHRSWKPLKGATCCQTQIQGQSLGKYRGSRTFVPRLSTTAITSDEEDQDNLKAYHKPSDLESNTSTRLHEPATLIAFLLGYRTSRFILSVLRQTPRLHKRRLRGDIAAVRHMRQQHVRSILTNLVPGMAVDADLALRHFTHGPASSSALAP